MTALLLIASLYLVGIYIAVKVGQVLFRAEPPPDAEDLARTLRRAESEPLDLSNVVSINRKRGEK